MPGVEFSRFSYSCLAQLCLHLKPGPQFMDQHLSHTPQVSRWGPVPRFPQALPSASLFCPAAGKVGRQQDQGGLEDTERTPEELRGMDG